MLMNLWVRDKTSGSVHQVGTDVHDSLEFIFGRVEYVNMQNLCGTGDNDPDGYEWTEPPNPNEYISVTPDELFLNREMIHGEIMRRLEDTDNSGRDDIV